MQRESVEKEGAPPPEAALPLRTASGSGSTRPSCSLPEIRSVSRRHVPAQAASVSQLTWYSSPCCVGLPDVWIGVAGRRRASASSQSTGSESSVTVWPGCKPVIAYLTGTDEPAFAVVQRRCRLDRRPERAGRSRARRRHGRSPATPSVRLVETPWLAPVPSPRLANPRQISHWFAPPVSARSAARIASRPSTKPGEHGWNFSPSMTSWIARLFPPGVPVGVDVRVVAVLGDEVPVHLPEHRVPDVADAVRLGDVDRVLDRVVRRRVDGHVGRVLASGGCPTPSAGWKLTYVPTPRGVVAVSDGLVVSVRP